MFKHFRSPLWAWAGGNPEEGWLIKHWFQQAGHRGRHRGGHPSGRSGHEGFDRGWGDEFRNRRGDIKFILLELLTEQPSHGYDLIKAMEARYGGFRRLSPGSVYPTLQMLEEGGYLTSVQAEGKRVYTITDRGRQILTERTQQESASLPGDAFKRFMTDKPQELIELRNEATQLAAAVMQVARSGQVEKMRQVRDRLEQVKREIYAMLAEE